MIPEGAQGESGTGVARGRRGVPEPEVQHQTRPLTLGHPFEASLSGDSCEGNVGSWTSAEPWPGSDRPSNDHLENPLLLRDARRAGQRLQLSPVPGETSRQGCRYPTQQCHPLGDSGTHQPHTRGVLAEQTWRTLLCVTAGVRGQVPPAGRGQMTDVTGDLLDPRRREPGLCWLEALDTAPGLQVS